ncbi:MAG TPA: CapA family protein, partial [Actinoplanes sp.]|nr:CapA family protein [Actinoplanes sp.]
MNQHPVAARRGLAGRPILTVTLVLAVLAGAGVGGMALAGRDGEPGDALWQEPAALVSATGPAPSA